MYKLNSTQKYISKIDNIIRTYIYASLLLAIFFLIFSSNFLYWLTNRISTTLYGPKLYDFRYGGPTLSGLMVHTILFGALIFGIVDFIYSTLLNGTDDSKITVE